MLFVILVGTNARNPRPAQPAPPPRTMAIMSLLKARGARSQEREVADLDAQRALKRLADAGVDADPDDAKHIEAYKALRALRGRVDAVSFRRYLDKKQSIQHHGAQEELEYWGVPRTNFPTGLPDVLKESLVSAKDLVHTECLGGQIDLVNYFVLDLETDRKKLGKNVRKLRCVV